MRKIVKNYWLLALVAGTVIAVDQITKLMIRTNLAYGESWAPIKSLPFFRIVHWTNTGAAFGMFQGGGLLFGFLALIVSAAIIIYFPQLPEDHKLLRVALAMQLGGALGNLIDRIKFGPVTDFIAVGSFPVFNIADACITIGVGLLLLNLWVVEHREKSLPSDEEGDNQNDSEHFTNQSET